MLDAARATVAASGVAGTSLDAIARRTGCSRATVYRLFPGGKDAVLAALVEAEVQAFLDRLTEALVAADGLEDVVVAGLTTASRALRDHPALATLLEREPEHVLPAISFARFDAVLARAAAFLAPFLSPHVGPERAARVGEWATRLVVSYALAPTPGVDLADEADARRFATTYLLPGLVPVAT